MTESRIAEQQLSRLAELLLGDEGTDAFKAIIASIAESSALRKKVAMIIRDHCADTMRPEIKRFAGLMEMKLRKHDPARGERWKTGDAEHHLERISFISEELERAVEDGRRVGLKAADLANHAMMLADQAGELEDV
jgi:hypothetical protein